MAESDTPTAESILRRCWAVGMFAPESVWRDGHMHTKCRWCSQGALYGQPIPHLDGCIAEEVGWLLEADSVPVCTPDDVSPEEASVFIGDIRVASFTFTDD